MKISERDWGILIVLVGTFAFWYWTKSVPATIAFAALLILIETGSKK